jgi:hypothetical protein
MCARAAVSRARRGRAAAGVGTRASCSPAVRAPVQCRAVAVAVYMIFAWGGTTRASCLLRPIGAATNFRGNFRMPTWIGDAQTHEGVLANLATPNRSILRKNADI